MADDDTTTAASTAELNDDANSDDIQNFYTSTPKSSEAENNNDLLMLSDHQKRKNFKSSTTQAKNRKRATIVRFSNESNSRKKYQTPESGKSRVMISTPDTTTHEKDNNFLRPTMSAVTRSTEALHNRLHEGEIGKRDSAVSMVTDEAGSTSSNEQKPHVCMISTSHPPLFSFSYITHNNNFNIYK